jgi:hypothetical protein
MEMISWCQSKLVSKTLSGEQAYRRSCVLLLAGMRNKQVRRHDFPDKKLANEAFTDDLEKLTKLSGLATEIGNEMQINIILPPTGLASVPGTVTFANTSLPLKTTLGPGLWDLL